MAENTLHPDHEHDDLRAPRRGPVRPLLALASLIPLALAAGAVATVPAPDPVPVTRAEAAAQPGASTRWCPGPLQVPDAVLEAGADPELSVVPPTDAISLRSVAVEPASSLLFGTVSGSETLQDDDGTVRAPSITAEGEDGTVLEDASEAQDLGVAVQSLRGVDGAPHVDAATSQGGRPVADVVQSTNTRQGDYRSLVTSRCDEPSTSASFLGLSTATGDSSELVLRNPSTRPATASVQVWTEEGPAAMEGRSQVVIAPGAEERVLLESIAPGQEAVGVDVSVLGAPLGMFVQTTEREGLTPGGAEILSPLPAAATEQVMPGVDVAGTDPILVLANPQGADTTAAVEVSGPDGPVEEAAIADLELPAGSVVRAPLTGLAEGTYTVSVRAEDPVTAVTRSSRTGEDLPGDTVDAPVDFALVSPAAAIRAHALLALPAQGAYGALTLSATSEATVTVIPVAADGSAGEPLTVDLAEDASTSVAAEQLRIDGDSAAAVTLVPDVPGAVHAGWMQRETAADGGTMLSALPVLADRDGGDEVTVRLAD
ncbi:DUF5719 family protein [Brachybacterium sp. YJGR34]|uniref:DUF5719 family protein n=1 Tax=Brachybacterium sp. YJGR34 TaxID=2059911 RepID=UPI000E0B1AB5|nr:DUF5719 family protein [Brachybacterium sp. YJGR34]